MDAITRAAAKALGLKKFFTGKPCKRGHVDERYVSNKGCVTCTAVLNATQERKSYDATRNSLPAVKAANRARHAAVYATPEGKIAILARSASYRATDAGKANGFASGRAWDIANPGKKNARTAMCRAKRLELKCSCCQPKDFHAIYRKAALLGHEVDHRTPKHLGGLHCVSNLQILTVADHRAKTYLENSAIRASRQHDAVTELRLAA